MRVGSSSDKAGTGQYYQMVRVRRTRREGVTRVNQWLNLRNCGTGSNLVDMGRGAARAERIHGEATSWSVIDAGFGGCRESLRRTCSEAVGAELGTAPVDRDTMNMGTLSCLPFPVCSQHAGGQGRAHPMGTAGGGVAVVVRGRESRPHGQGRQRVRNSGRVMPGGRR